MAQMAASSLIQTMPSAAAILNAYNVNLSTQEVVQWEFYDSVAYPAAGLVSAALFQLPVGQGVGVGGGAKTLSDTNMTSNGMMPAQQNFLCFGIEVLFLPTIPTVAAAMPSAFGAGVAAVQVNDQYIVERSGNLVFTIGSKPYFQAGPLLKMPPRSRFGLNGALSDATSAAASQQSRLAIGYAEGPQYGFNPPFMLTSNQNFNVTLAWPEGLQLITNPGRIWVTLSGLLLRSAQ